MPVDGAHLWALNHRLLTNVLAECTTELTDLGLEPKEFFVLAEVVTSPYPAELAAALVIPKASVTIYVRSLVGKGLMRREIDEDDLRRHRLALTGAGERVRERALCALAAAMDRRLTTITPGDRAELQRILLTLLQP